MVAEEGDVQQREDREEEVARSEDFIVEENASCEESCLARFSKFLGFSIAGHEEEILGFMKRFNAGRQKGNGKGGDKPTKFNREMKKLVWNVTDMGRKKDGAPGKGARAFLSRLLMKIKILSWNVRGANDVAKRKVIKAFIRMQRVDVVCMQETKFKEVSSGLIRSLGVGRFLDWATLRAKGASGGIVIFWDSCVFKLLAEEGQFTVSCRFKSLVDDCTWIFMGVYGPTAYGNRDHL